MVLSSVIPLDERKSFVLTNGKTRQEISDILKERYPDRLISNEWKTIL